MKSYYLILLGMFSLTIGCKKDKQVDATLDHLSYQLDLRDSNQASKRIFRYGEAMRLVLNEKNLHQDSSIRFAYQNMKCQSPVLAFQIRDRNNRIVGDLAHEGLYCTLVYRINTLAPKEERNYSSYWRAKQIGNTPNGVDTTYNDFLPVGKYSFEMTFTVTQEEDRPIAFDRRPSKDIALSLEFEVVK